MVLNDSGMPPGFFTWHMVSGIHMECQVDKVTRQCLLDAVRSQEATWTAKWLAFSKEEKLLTKDPQGMHSAMCATTILQVAVTVHHEYLRERKIKQKPTFIEREREREIWRLRDLRGSNLELYPCKRAPSQNSC
jgi:hypothetical protein